MTKGLFTNLEEIAFHYNYVQGHAKKVQDPNISRNPAETKKLCSHKRNTKIKTVYRGRIRSYQNQ